MNEARDRSNPEPLQRRTYQAAQLARRHPAVLRHENKQVLFAIGCPADAIHAGQLEYSRWPEIPLPRQVDPARAAGLVVVRDGYYDYRPTPDPGIDLDWYVNFADPNLFYAYGSTLFAQDEIQDRRAPHPRIPPRGPCFRGAPDHDAGERSAHTVLVMGAERRVSIATGEGAVRGGPSWLYGMAFANAMPDAIRQATARIDPPTRSNIIAIVAPYGGHGRYQREQIELALSTAYSGFRAAVLESQRSTGSAALVAIHTGFWGCGAFGGNRVMMTLLQVLAAEMAGVARLVFHIGDASGRDHVEHSLALAADLVAESGTARPDPSTRPWAWPGVPAKATERSVAAHPGMKHRPGATRHRP